MVFIFVMVMILAIIFISIYAINYNALCEEIETSRMWQDILERDEEKHKRKKE